MQTYDAWHNQVDLATHSEKVGKFEIAEKNWLHALKVAESAPDGAELKVYTLQRLGRCAWAQDRPVDAEQYYFLALEGSPSPEMMASITEDMARFYGMFNRRDKATNYFRYAIELKSEILGEDHDQVQSLKSDFAQLENSWKAPEIQEEVMPAAEAQPAPQSKAVNLGQAPNEADNIVRKWEQSLEQAEIRHREGNLEQCHKLWKEALDIAELCGKDTPMYCTTLEKGAQLMIIQGEHKQGERLLLESYSIKMKVLGPDHESIAKTTQELSIMYFEQGDLDKAEPWANRSLDIYENLGLENEAFACSLHNLAVLYHSKSELAKAEPFYARALIQKQRIYGSTHIETINIMRGYAELLKTTGRPEAAKEMEDAASGVLSGSYQAQPYADQPKEEYIPVDAVI